MRDAIVKRVGRLCGRARRDSERERDGEGEGRETLYVYIGKEKSSAVRRWWLRSARQA
jgi:hypothetical protein